MQKIKPRIHRLVKRNRVMGIMTDTWVCRHFSTPWSGYGSTPTDAYESWINTNRYFLHARNEWGMK
jgi:hypothetical protein